MEQRTKGLPASIEVQSGRRIRVIASTAREDREGDIIEVAGWDLSAFRRNPVVLFQHDASKPIGRCIDIGVLNGRLEATVEFPPSGTSELADEVHGLVRHGAVSAVSVGFLPRETTPNRNGWGLRITKAELLELSLVSIPANPDCLVVQRTLAAPNGGITPGKRLTRAQALRQVQRLRMLSEIMELRHAVLPDMGIAAHRRAELEQLKAGGILRKHLVNACES